MSNTKRLWHYTTGEKFEAISREGTIKPAVENVPTGEKPAVWFSFNQVWERTASKGIVVAGVRRTATMEEMNTLGGGLVRIAVALETAPHTWVRFRHLSGINPSHAKALALVAKSDGANPNDWRATFDAVPSALWTTIEKFDRGTWVRFSLFER
ncbi:MAG: hypothetical protein IAE78_32760 [Myxococcus sp.]|nr:hypothetical protein [Myxococcus sp.]